MDTPAVVRSVETEDEAALRAIVARARSAGELLGCSDPSGSIIVDHMLLEPHHAAVAVVGGEVGGFLDTSFKIVVVEPQHRRRGLGLMLVRAGIDIQRRRAEPRLFLGPPPGDRGAIAFLQATAFEFHSFVQDLWLPAEHELQEPEWPEGIVARNPSPPNDLIAYVEAWNAAFATHPTPLSATEERTRYFWDLYPDDLGHTIVIEESEAPGRIVGLCVALPGSPDQGTPPEVHFIAVIPELQGRGLGRQLLRWGVAHLRELGETRIRLSVNAINEGALRLYEQNGFERESSLDRWARTVD